MRKPKPCDKGTYPHARYQQQQGVLVHRELVQKAYQAYFDTYKDIDNLLNILIHSATWPLRGP